MERMDGEVIIKPPARIARSSVPVDTVTLARYLLGKVLVHELDDATVTGRIVETEAYLPGDPACHAYRGMTTRNKTLFLEHGRCYIYLCYGTSYMLNLSSEQPGVGAGVLVRALQPLHGIDHMRRMSSRDRIRDLARGPGRLTSAFNVDRRHDGLDLFSDPRLWIGSDDRPAEDIAHSVRIGISKAADERLRYFIPGNVFVSGPRALNAVTDSNAA